ncbi:MAG: YdeI/OmpD-associated family protein, partial [Bacteroidota bacterium]
MQITEIFYPKNRKEWYDWLKENHNKKSEICVQKYLKATGKPSIAYDDLVEGCLCFGWIDSVVKKNCPEGNVQRITPRRKKKTFLSELNRQRVWKLQHTQEMVPVGEAPIADQIGSADDPLEIPDWLQERLKLENVWLDFQEFPNFYKRLKIGWILELGTAPSRQADKEKRIAHLVKMTEKGKMYGTQPLKGIL